MIELKQKIIKACKHLKRLDYLGAADGNISCRIDRERILITPSGRNKEFITEEEIALIDLSGVTVSGEPSSEKLVHLAIFNTNAEAKWIMHAHPPYSVAWSLAFSDQAELDIRGLPEVILGAGRVPIVPYCLPGTVELSTSISEVAKNNKTLIMQRHGVLAWGESWEEAINGIERVEHAARTLSIAYSMGECSPLSEAELKRIFERRSLDNRTL